MRFTQKFFCLITCLIMCGVLVLVGTENAFANQAHTILSKLSDPEKNATLTKFMKQSDEDCDTVVKNFFQGFDKDRNAYWNVACKNKKSFVIMIENDSAGSTKIMSCDLLKMLNAGECFKKF